MTDWFPYEEDEETPGLSPGETAFLAALREAAGRWPVPFAGSWAARGETEPSLLAVVSLIDSEARVSLGDFGVHVLGDRARGDLLHNQLYTLPDEPTGFAIDVTGPPQQLAAECAKWFEALLSKPVVHARWRHAGAVYAQLWSFGDTGEGLVQSYDAGSAPRHQEADLQARGHVRGRGWVQVAGIEAAPDEVRRVR
ncbi:hypothetical protein [Amycolatopsis vancoresmycina]|uniref:Uncharacterized protein n=1 Tax=Amycolatopsis vancoresmycina DSM 44592 TaxID=1292037 RepID=R1FWX3_9PSEU|nr:hypothetical protein [Amycolatopsis vancoresmycina]EOD63883.1 hypothetical protein H480_34726 [Amycolatopsis vancoresmycina DSM 44592]